MMRSEISSVSENRDSLRSWISTRSLRRLFFWCFYLIIVFSSLLFIKRLFDFQSNDIRFCVTGVTSGVFLALLSARSAYFTITLDSNENIDWLKVVDENLRELGYVDMSSPIAINKEYKAGGLVWFPSKEYIFHVAFNENMIEVRGPVSALRQLWNMLNCSSSDLI